MADRLSPGILRSLIQLALREDAASHDITSRAIIPPNLRIRARIVAKSSGILAGVKLAALTFTTFDPSIRCRLHARSGATLLPGTTVLSLEGRARSIFAAERVALNFLMHLSGIATLTRAFIDRARGTRAVILDTRKTLPGLRALEKNAVRAGGGQNHRFDLGDAVLIKTNHLRVLGRGRAAIEQAVTSSRGNSNRRVEIEATNLAEYRAALTARPDAILLDNWPLNRIRQAVRLARSESRARRPLLEVSGGVTLDNVRAMARTGVDRISIGRLTHSALALDFSLQVH